MIVLGRFLAIIFAISYCYLGYVDFVGPFSLGIISVGCLLLVIGFLQILIRQTSLHKNLIFVLTIGLCMIWLDTVINGYFSIKTAQQFITPIAVFFVAYGISKYLNFTKWYLLFFSGLILISCLVASFQALDIDAAWNLRYMFPVSDDEVIEFQIANRLKPAGLAFYAVQLGYQMVLCGLLLLVLNGFDVHNSSRRLVIIGLIIVLTTAMLGLNLSPLLSVLIMLYVYFLNQGRFSFKIKHVFSVVFALTVILISPIGERILTVDASMLSRITFTIVGVIIVLNNPFGVKAADLYDKKMEVVNQLFGVADLAMLEDILDMGFHNSFLNVGVQLGWLGFFIYILFYCYLVRYYFVLSKHTNSVQSKLGSAGYAFLLGYFVQTVTHNAGPFNLDIYFWFGHGLLLGIIMKTRESLTIPIFGTTKSVA